MSWLFRKKKAADEESSTYVTYTDTRDEAWRILAECKTDRLPVDLLQICELQQIELYSYAQAQVLIRSLHLQAFCKQGDCLVLVPDGRRILLYDDAVCVEMRRFLIAGGVGHFVLGHTDGKDLLNGAALCFSDEEKLQAGIFAGRLLAPLSVLWAMGVGSSDELRQMCIVPETTARKRFDRLCEIDARNLERGVKTGQGTLFLSGYERSAFRNFSLFAEEYRRNKKSSF